MRHNRLLLPLSLIGAAGGAVAAFVVLTKGVDTHKTKALDARARRQFPKRRRPATRKAAELVQPLGKWFGQVPMGLGVSAMLWRANRRSGALSIAGASATAASLAWLLEQTMTPRKPPPGRHSPTEPAFPSGHALQTSALALTTAYVLSREGIVNGATSVPLATILPLSAGLVKLYLDKHWFTDVLGGYLLGATIAASAAAAFELGRPSS
jgi:undecaprenyl-diphosphatase